MNIYILLFCLSLTFGVTGQLLLKKGMMKTGKMNVFSGGFIKNVWKMFTNPFVFIGIMFFGASSLLWLVTLSGLELSYIYPMVSLSYVLVALASKFFFKEKVSKMRWVSIAVIILGVILVSSS